MIKKNAKNKTYSLSERTRTQIEFLKEFYNLKETSLIEFVINKEFKNIKEIEESDSLKI